VEQTDPVRKDALSFLSFYQRQRPALTAAFRQMTDDTRYIDDAVQEALLIARRKWPQISTYDKPEAWVAKVALRLMRRWQHHDHQHLQDGEPVEPAPSADQHELTHQHDDLYAAIAVLPPRQRQAIVLHYLLDFTIEEAAGILGRATGTVKAHLHTARGKLKVSLGERASR
jgi:RNA polymerase sigma-70 factor (ECF subfamily)